MSVKPQPTRSAATPAAKPAQPQAQPAQPPAQPAQIDENKLRELTEQLAYELYEKRGRSDGNHEQDWLEAEKIARARLQSKNGRS